MVVPVRTALALGLGCLMCALPGTARAHGRPPKVERIAFDPNDPERIVLQFSYGLIVSEDGGASWRWICGAAYGIDPSWEEPDLSITEDGSTVIGTFNTAMRAAPDLCTFEEPEGPIDDTQVLDLARHPEDPDVIWALTTRGGTEPEHLQQTRDGGRSWALVGEPFRGVLLESLAVAPSDPARIYVSAIVPRTASMERTGRLFRSDDGGETFAPIDIAIGESERAPRIVGVDPTNAERIFVRVPRDVADREPERLLYSDDGGASFVTAHALRHMRGFAISEDGRTVWAGSGSGDGVWVARDGTLSFTQVSTLHVRCLQARGDELWLCVDQIASRFALGRSLDGGETVEELLYLDDLRDFPECATCAATAVICPFWMDDLRMDFERYLQAQGEWPTVDPSIPEECIEPEPDAGPRVDAGLDGGVAMDGGEGSAPAPGCGCRAAGAERSGSLALVTLALVFALRRRRR